VSEDGLRDATAPFVEGVKSIEALDPVGQRVAKTIRGALGPGKLKDALSGRPIGHALHPLLTDVVIGSFVSATLLDVIGGAASDEAAERLISVGIAAYVPTAATGAADWADSEPLGPDVRRVGLVHATANAIALGLYTGSLRARRSGNRGRGKILALLGGSALAAGGLLGGHMSFVLGIGVNQTAFDAGPGEWTDAADAASVSEDDLEAVTVGDTPVLLVRRGDRVLALHDRCSHRGCPLSDGELDGEVVECGCHGSRFRLADGGVERGPATTPQPAYEARERDGRIEIRLPA
jgi:nitrite reductase/ring-hydroxylating ferredoxin subunit